MIKKIEISLDMSRREVENSAEKVRAFARSIKHDMERLIEKINEKDYDLVNTSGEVQGKGLQLDMTCQELKMLMRKVKQMEFFLEE